MVNSHVEYMNNHKEKEKTYDEFVCNRSMDNNACKKELPKMKRSAMKTLNPLQNEEESLFAIYMESSLLNFHGLVNVDTSKRYVDIHVEVKK
jgi:hypothetical protein